MYSLTLSVGHCSNYTTLECTTVDMTTVAVTIVVPTPAASAAASQLRRNLRTDESDATHDQELFGQLLYVCILLPWFGNL